MPTDVDVRINPLLEEQQQMTHITDVDILSKRGVWINNLLNSYTKSELDSMFERALNLPDHTKYDGRTKYTSVFEAMLHPNSFRFPSTSDES